MEDGVEGQGEAVLAGVSVGGVDLREESILVARWVDDLAGPAYGPQGGAKLLVDPSGGLAWTRSGATAVREAAAVHPALAPYQNLATSVSRLAGDQATGSLLLAAALVRAAEEAAGEGLPIPSSLQGYALALRQTRAWLAANAGVETPGFALSAVGPNAAVWAPVALAGLRELARDGELDLDAIDVQAEPVGPADRAAHAGRGQANQLDEPARWLPGLLLRPSEDPTLTTRAPRPVRVLVVLGGWSAKPRVEGVSYRYADATAGSWGESTEAVRRKSMITRLEGLNVGVILVSKSLDADLAAALRGRGILVWTDAPRGALHRASRCTGATPIPDLQTAALDDLGRGRLEPRPHRRGGWLLSGAGPSGTFVVQGGNNLVTTVAVEEAERFLRTAGQVLRDSRSLPGGGRWQRELASALRKAADAAPGKAPLAVRAAANAFDSLADHLVRNSGGDPLRRGVAPGADAVHDSQACVRIAVDAAFELAQQLLRIDARHTKPSSSALGLRGGSGRIGSPKGMPGDNPPLM